MCKQIWKYYHCANWNEDQTKSRCRIVIDVEDGGFETCPVMLAFEETCGVDDPPLGYPHEPPEDEAWEIPTEQLCEDCAKRAVNEDLETAARMVRENEDDEDDGNSGAATGKRKSITGYGSRKRIILSR